MKEPRNLRRILYGVLCGCAFTFVPLLVLALHSDSGIVNSLKWVCAGLGVPGAALGIIAASGRMDDASLWVTGSANLIFYSALSYVFLAALDKSKQKRRAIRAEEDL
jgi:hypothetical protein